MQLKEYQMAPPLAEVEFNGVEKENGRYTWEKKYSVVNMYLNTGNMRLTAQKCGVNAATIEQWRKASWWSDAVAEIRNADSAVLDNKLKKSVDKALSLIDDMLENGETILNNKTGELVKKPIGIRDATRVASDLMQRQNDLKKNQLEQEVGRQTTQEMLKTLAAEFAKFNNNIKSSAEDIEFVEVVPNAVHEERET